MDYLVENSTSFAKYLKTQAKKRGIDMNMTKLMKLMYICYGTSLAAYGKRLFNEQPQAWPYGPVFALTRQQMMTANNWNEECENLNMPDNKVENLVYAVLNTFGNWSATQLSSWTHKTGSPWDKTIKQYAFAYGTPISDNDIKSYFQKILK